MLVAVLSAVFCGCMPSSQGTMDEQKESFYLMGKARANALDSKGAIEAFERAIEANPRNGSAHFELGLLCEKEQDYSAAIYHFERFLKLRPDSEYAQTVKGMIMADKMELSKTVASTPVNQRELEDLRAKNRQLQDEMEKLRIQLAQAQGRVPVPVTNPGRQGSSGSGASGSGSTGSGLSQSEQETQRGSGTMQPIARPYTVKAGDTPTLIARQHGVKLEALMAANRGLDARRMKVGQVINIPPI